MNPAPLSNTIAVTPTTMTSKDFVYKPGPRKVKQATLHAETLWPGKLGAETSLNPSKYPDMKMLWVPGDGLILQWKDGSTYTVAANNVKGMEHFTDATT